MGDYQAGKAGNLHGAPSRFIVTLNEFDSRICTWVGKQRNQMARKNNRDQGLGVSSKNAELSVVNDIRGVHCEYAASLAFNLSWRPIKEDFFTMKDVGDIIEVRSTDLPNGRLIIRENEPTKNPYVPYLLVDCQQMDKLVFVMQGWMLAKDAPLYSRLLTEHGDPAYFLKKKDLHSNESLVDWVTVRRAFD